MPLPPVTLTAPVNCLSPPMLVWFVERSTKFLVELPVPPWVICTTPVTFPAVVAVVGRGRNAQHGAEEIVDVDVFHLGNFHAATKGRQ